MINFYKNLFKERWKCWCKKPDNKYIFMFEKFRQEIPEQHNKNPKRVFQETSGHPEDFQVSGQWQRRSESEFQRIQTTFERVPTEPQSERPQRTFRFVRLGQKRKSLYLGIRNHGFQFWLRRSKR